MAITTAPGNENDDALLIAAVVRGDMGAFKKVIDKYERLVVSITFKMISQKEDVEDICQDVFLKVYEKLPAFRFQSKLSTWIGSIAFNTCLNFVQKRRPVLLNDLLDKETNDENFHTSPCVSTFVLEYQVRFLFEQRTEMYISVH